MSIAERLLKLRKGAGFTQEEMAEKLNISRQSVAKWENSDSIPDINRFIELGKLFGVSIDYLLKGENIYSLSKDKVDSSRKEMKEFLVLAKRNTYAAHAPEVESSRKGSRDLYFEKGKYSYLDSYFGGEKFIGEEVLYVDNTPSWSMNFMGRILDDNFSGDFLKDALKAVSIERPFRGPEIFSNGNFTYHNRVEGSFEWFHGEEEIFFQDIKVYKAIFHGSLIK